MGPSESRRESMNSFEKVLARICLEHGWAGRSQIADAVRARGQEGGSQELLALLVARGVLTREQAATLEAEASDVTRTGAYADVREDDTQLGQLLVRAGVAPEWQVKAALEIQALAAAKKALVPRLGEILIEKGVLTYGALQEVLGRQSQFVQLACSACGKRFTTEKKEAGKVYVCDECASPLGSATRIPAVPSSEPEEVSQASSDPANVLGKYVLVSHLGKGAMGAVYKAWDRGLRRWVAIKLLLATSDPNLVLRFRREAETAAAIQHPNIVPIYDVGEEGGRPFLVMKFVEGSTLAGMSLSLAQAVAVTLQAAKGVAHAHERDVVHRDLKPGNIMVDGSGHVFVMDFGLAKDLYSISGLTAPGTLMGTPSYMPPEQAAGRTSEVDRTSDVYSLGAIFYELLAGRPPFKATKPMETIRQVLEDPLTPPTKLRSGIPPELERFVLRALEKEKAKRFPTAGVFAKALELVAPAAAPAESGPRVAPGAVPAALAPSRSRRVVVFWTAVLLVLSILSGLGVLHLLRGGIGPGK